MHLTETCIGMYVCIQTGSCHSSEWGRESGPSSDRLRRWLKNCRLLCLHIERTISPEASHNPLKPLPLSPLSESTILGALLASGSGEMSYSAYFTRANFSFPTGFAGLVGGLFYLNTFTGRPATGTKEVTMAEYNATPLVYLQSPDRHPTRSPKVKWQDCLDASRRARSSDHLDHLQVPGMSDVPHAYDELMHKVHAKGHGHAHH